MGAGRLRHSIGRHDANGRRGCDQQFRHHDNSLMDTSLSHFHGCARFTEHWALSKPEIDPPSSATFARYTHFPYARPEGDINESFWAIA
jgi:hypothetical protein